MADLVTLQLEGGLGLSVYAADGWRPFDRIGSSDSASARHDDNYNRLTGSLQASLSTTLSRVYNGGPGQAVATHHQMSPTISYTHIEAPDDQDELPYWDSFDRQLSRRSIRYGLLNTFVSKTPLQDENGQDIGFDYFQFLKVGLWSSHNFTDHTEWAADPYARYYTTGYYSRGAGLVELEIETAFNPFFSARLQSDFASRTGKIVNTNLSFNARDARGDSLTLAYRYDSISSMHSGASSDDYENYEELRADLSLVLNSEWKAEFSTRYDLEFSRSLENQARLIYKTQDFDIGLFYSAYSISSGDDHRMGLFIVFR